MPFALVFLIASIILFILAALNVGAPRWSLGWAGMACFALAVLLGGSVSLSGI